MQTNPGVNITRLENGIKVVTDRMSSVDSVSLGAWFSAGTRNEAAHVNGVAHLLEHMVFKGTDQRSAREIVEQIELVGGHLNAYTSREQTAYFGRVLKDDTNLAIEILADILQHSIFDKTELHHERSVVIQEIGQTLDTPDDVIFDYFQETAYPNQAMGRPVLGRAEIVSEISRENILEFIIGNYATERLVFSAAGNVDHGQVVDTVETHFKTLSEKKPSVIESADYIGGDFRQMKDLEQVHILIGFPGVAYTHADFYALQVLSMLLGGGMSSRLFQEVREKRGLAYSIQSFTTSHRDGGLMGIYAGTGEHQILEMVPVISDELNKIDCSDIEEEVYRSKIQLKSALLMSREATSNRCEQLAQQLLIHKRVRSIDEIIGNVEEVDIGSVKRVIKNMLREAPTLAAIGPVSKLETYAKFEKRFG